jgi:hypothetical protein
MKFIEVGKARNLEIDVPVFTKNDKGEYGFGKLIEEKKTASGMQRTFESARFGHGEDPHEVTNITHICIPKSTE